MGLTITDAHIVSADLAGACLDKIRMYPLGSNLDVDLLSFLNAVWVTRNMPDLAAEVRRETGVPLWALVRRGSGNFVKSTEAFCNDDGFSSNDWFADAFDDFYGEGCGDGTGEEYGLDRGDFGGISEAIGEQDIPGRTYAHYV